MRVCQCVCTCMEDSLCTHGAHVRPCFSARLHGDIDACRCERMYIDIYLSVKLHVYTHTHVCTCMYTYTCTYTRTSTSTHTFYYRCGIWMGEAADARTVSKCRADERTLPGGHNVHVDMPAVAKAPPAQSKHTSAYRHTTHECSAQAVPGTVTNKTFLA